MGGESKVWQINITEDDLKAMEDSIEQQLRFWLEGVIVAVFAVLGVLGNLVSSAVLVLKKRHLDLQPLLRRLLVLLAAFDTVFLVAAFANLSLVELSRTYRDTWHPVLAPKMLIPLSQIALTGSVYTTLAVTLERYLSCCWPYLPTREGKAVNCVCIAAIITFSVTFNVVRFFEYRAERQGVSDLGLHPVLRRFQESLPKEVVRTELKDNSAYVRYYLLVANFTVMMLIPLTSLAFLNWKIHKAIRNRDAFRANLKGQHTNGKDHRREVTIGQILALIVVTFVVCQSFKVVVNGYEVYIHVKEVAPESGYPPWVLVVINLNHVALAFNAAVNTVIYIYKDRTFRAACANLFRCSVNGNTRRQQLRREEQQLEEQQLQQLELTTPLLLRVKNGVATAPNGAVVGLNTAASLNNLAVDAGGQSSNLPVAGGAKASKTSSSSVATATTPITLAESP